jgi:hypothetical protein
MYKIFIALLLGALYRCIPGSYAIIAMGEERARGNDSSLLKTKLSDGSGREVIAYLCHQMILRA